MGRAKDMWIEEKDELCQRYIDEEITYVDFIVVMQNYCSDMQEVADLACELETER